MLFQRYLKMFLMFLKLKLTFHHSFILTKQKFAERLTKYMNKMTPCAQKGYANGRYCQEVLIGVIDTIKTCKAKKIMRGSLILDIQKAFDSLSHSYLQNIFKFYNFGPTSAVGLPF
jgi:hypothetical protein